MLTQVSWAVFFFSSTLQLFICGCCVRIRPVRAAEDCNHSGILRLFGSHAHCNCSGAAAAAAAAE